MYTFYPRQRARTPADRHLHVLPGISMRRAHPLRPTRRLASSIPQLRPSFLADFSIRSPSDPRFLLTVLQCTPMSFRVKQ
ncbi:hypothetical protein GY45DRAFT_1319795 [Cubamyces sp. BRFM 1775]|nr:hypothetical protein GY45DRAFT_1319795 [Cubamyces sp. BRFM 1775]